MEVIGRLFWNKSLNSKRFQTNSAAILRLRYLEFFFTFLLGIWMICVMKIVYVYICIWISAFRALLITIDYTSLLNCIIISNLLLSYPQLSAPCPELLPGDQTGGSSTLDVRRSRLQSPSFYWTKLCDDRETITIRNLFMSFTKNI